MPINIEEYIEENTIIIQDEIIRHIEKLSIPNRLKESMIYSLHPGGKKLRPILMLASFETFNKGKEKVYQTAAALEMIHTYSLIHDDLPAMDDDDLRRGIPTNHRRFDEATAILAGDALLTYSFELIVTDPLLSDNEKVEIINMLSRKSGPSGMVAGQILDLEAENTPCTLEELENIHSLKTGKLLTFAIKAGAFLGQASKEQLAHLMDFSYYLGLIFQVQDDILDVIGNEKKLGKRVGSDAGNEKSTYPKLLGIDGSINKKEEYVFHAKEALAKANPQSAHLLQLTDYLTKRDH